MRLRESVRRAVGYHLRALPSTLAGLGIAGAGVWYGVDGGASATALAAGGRLVPAVGLVAAGAAVLAVGRTAVRIDATAAAVSDRVAAESGLDEDDLRETVAIAAERAVADSVDGATTELEARVADAVGRAVSEADPSSALPGSDGEPLSRADALDAFARTSPPEANALADATRRASERVESYLAGDDAGVGEFRRLAEGATVLEGGDDGAETDDADGTTGTTESGSAAGNDADAPNDSLAPTADAAARSDGAEILDGTRPTSDSSDGGDGDAPQVGLRGSLNDADDAVIIDGDGGDDDDGEMVFGGDVRDPESEGA